MNIKLFTADTIEVLENKIRDFSNQEKWITFISVTVSVHAMKDYNYNDWSVANQWSEYLTTIIY